ncbi:ABC transporter ATP-binding protein [Clostridium sp.]|uniref:ABC transporter ATP-binding protein n=1 Tax=Clostridium sp. TaxID=1506 RepID=UPI003464B401
MSILEVSKLETCYESFVVFKDIDLKVEEGKITTIIGPNGCGKSTLLKTMGRIIKPSNGEVYLKGENITKIQTKQIAKSLALLPQNPVAPPELKVEELVSYGRFPHCKKINKLTSKDKEIIEWAINVTKVTDFKEREIGCLSGGQRQKVWLAMALAQETDILLLDEPTTYLDMSHQLEVLKIVEELNKERKCTVVMVLHDINQAARFSHNIVAMRSGKIVATGKPEDVITKPVLKEVFNIEARIIIDETNGAPVCFGYDNI